MPEIQLIELQDIKNVFGPFFIPFTPTILAAKVLFIVMQLIPKGFFRQVFGILSLVLLVAVYIYSTANTAKYW